MRPELAGKKAVVLGASAERGSGGAIARALRDAGCEVMIAARRSDLLAEFAERIGVRSFVCDATDDVAVASSADHAVTAFGGLDIAINAAGAPMRATIADATRERLTEALELNYLAHVWFVRHMARVMGPGASIVLISSISGTCVTDGTVFPYSCAKAATNCLVQCAAVEYGPQGIRVNAILLGPIEPASSRGVFLDPALRAAFEKEVPLGRIAQPEDIADAALWLAGPAFATGLNLQINGGMHLFRLPTAAEVGGAKAYENRPLPA